jgi:carboxypeptidase Q
MPLVSLRRRRAALRAALVGSCLLAVPAGGAGPGDDLDRLVSALLADTPLVSDLRSLTDEVGGRATGSPANTKAVEWALARFQAAGVPARKEAFSMPELWLERGTRATVSGDLGFEVRAVSMPFSAATPRGGLRAPLRDAGTGSEADLARLGESAQGAFLVVETQELKDLDGLFREYSEAAAIEKRAVAAGAVGVAYMGSRPRNLLYRHNASVRGKVLLVVEREAAGRVLRLLRAGKRLNLTAEVDLETGGPYTSYNVIGEIRGAEKPDEIVILGAHLDSWDLGAGALDNGCNVALLIDVARQVQALGLRPRRTLRFALWNGEEQGLFGSWAYTRDHAAELDRHVMAASFDIGSGRITGFFTGHRPELVGAVDRALQPLAGLGPFQQVDEPIVGTDNFDFMLQGVGNLVANQEPATYGPDYHARSDTFDKVDLRQLRLNAAIAAALAWGFANGEAGWGRQSAADVGRLVETTSLKAQMESFGLYEQWASGKRGLRP